MAGNGSRKVCLERGESLTERSNFREYVGPLGRQDHICIFASVGVATVHFSILPKT
jgi:hypothetical protein